MKYWAYKHTNGEIKVKVVREMTDADIDEAYESPFVEDVMEPVEAKTPRDALKVARRFFREEAYA